MHLRHILKYTKKVKLPSAGWYAFTLLLFSGFLVFEVTRMSYAEFKYPTALPPGDNPEVATSTGTGGGGTVAYDECAQGLFVGLSRIKYSDAIRGYTAANDECRLTTGIEGSHVCSSAEIGSTIKCKSSIDPADNINKVSSFTATGILNRGGFINSGSPGSILAPATDCLGWTTTSSSEYGIAWNFLAVGGKPMVKSCNNTSNYRFACCK